MPKEKRLEHAFGKVATTTPAQVEALSQNVHHNSRSTSVTIKRDKAAGNSRQAHPKTLLGNIPENVAHHLRVPKNQKRLDSRD